MVCGRGTQSKLRARGRWLAWSSGPSTSPLEAMAKRCATVLLVPALLLVAGCVLVFHQYAKLDLPAPEREHPYRVELHTVVGPYYFHWEGGAFARDLVDTDIYLPRSPTGRAVYSWREVHFESSDDDWMSHTPPTGGTVTVDLLARKLEVDIQVESGRCPINGTYKLKLEKP